MALQRGAENPLAAAVAVGPRSVEEVAAQLDCLVERGVRFLVVAAAPSGHAPHSVADIRHLPARAPERSIPHAAPSRARPETPTPISRRASRGLRCSFLTNARWRSSRLAGR